MSMNKWIASPEFLAVWKDAFRDVKKAFVGLSEDASTSSKRERTGGLWTQIQKPYPGVHLLAIELQPDITPLTIRLKVWVDQNSQHLYDVLRSANPPELLGQRTVLSAGQKPRASWESQLRKRGVSLIGLSYTLSDLSFLSDTAVSAGKLRRMGEEFIAWLTANLGGNRSSVQVTQATTPLDSEDQKGLANPEVTSPATPETALELEQQLQARIQESRNLTAEERRRRLALAGAKPVQVEVRTWAFVRNAHVIVIALERAAGRCEGCGRLAPFLRASDGTPYLEVHHVVQLSMGGEDSDENAQALCPNCHRRLHHGQHAQAT